MIQSRPRRSRATVPETGRYQPVPDTASETVIPYDYAATFKLRGIPGNIEQDVVNISAEGAFVAVAIGYGLQEDQGRPLPVDVSPTPGTFRPGEVQLGMIPEDALLTGFRINPDARSQVFREAGESLSSAVPRLPSGEVRLSDDQVSVDLAQRIFQKVKSPEPISFLFSMVDSGSGRELQDEPIHNLASLGRGDGLRPFRPLARPIHFMPRSTIRLQVIEHSEGTSGTLFIVLYGYKVLRGSGCPEPVARTLRGPAACPVETIGSPSDRVIPFDYVTSFKLTGKRGNRVTDEAQISVEGGFVATAVGYGLAVDSAEIKLIGLTPASENTLINLREGVSLLNFPPSALIGGFRVRPGFVRAAFGANGQLTAGLPARLIDRVFEPLNQPEAVSFQYTFLDGGTGRELQNRPIYNIAGLGIANGMRPFKRFVRPLLLQPRSTFQVTVTEDFGAGRLFIVLQGYKILRGAAARRGR